MLPAGHPAVVNALEIRPARPLVEVAFSTVTGTRTGVDGASGTVGGSVTSGGRVSDAAPSVGAATPDVAGVVADVSRGSGDENDHPPSTARATTATRTSPSVRRPLRGPRGSS